MIFCVSGFFTLKNSEKSRVSGFPEKKQGIYKQNIPRGFFSSTPFFLHILTVHVDITAKSLQQWMLMTPSLEYCHLENQPQWELDKSNVMKADLLAV